MNGPAHVIDIGSVVLDGVDVAHMDRTGALLEAQVARALAGLPAGALPNEARGEARIAREVSRAVIGAIPGAAHGT
jgi:hypothetical protein